MWFALVLNMALSASPIPSKPAAAPGPALVGSPPEITAAESPDLTISPPAIAPIELAKIAAAPPDRWALMQSIQGSWYGSFLDDCRMSISGWSELAYTASTDRREQLPMGFNYLANQLDLQQNWLRIERTVDVNSTTPTWGFRSDNILPGIDYRYTVARGLFDSQLSANDGAPNRYGFDPVQFYAELYLPEAVQGLDVKAGRFYAQFGVENIETTQNALVSHAYNFIYNPFTHTGVLTTLKLSNAWSVQNGIATGSDVFIGPEANPTYLGSVKWAPPDGRDGVLFAVVLGSGRYNVSRSFSNPEIFDLVYTHNFGDRLKYIFDGLYSFQDHFPGVGDRGLVNNWGAANYLTYQISRTVTGAIRAEVFGDPQGQRTGTKGTYQEYTAGATYKPKPWLSLRPEIRYDYNRDRPFEGKADLFTAAFDVVFRW